MYSYEMPVYHTGKDPAKGSGFPERGSRFYKQSDAKHKPLDKTKMSICDYITPALV